MESQDENLGVQTVVLDNLIPDEDLEITEITGKDRLRLAGHCLAWLLVVFVVSMFCYIGATEQSKDAAEKVWSDVTKLVPPIVTLVIGYFFGSRESSS